MAALLNRICVAINRLECAIASALGRRFPPEGLAFAGFGNDLAPKQLKPTESVFDSILLAVPKHRRTIERRWKRMYGNPYYVLKILLPKKNIRVCNVCGDDHEAGILCPTCYKRVIDETKAMQDKIQENLQLEPVEKEVVVLYDGEKEQQPPEFWNGKRIVEMKKSRPNWFSKNLLQQTTQQNATTSDVKPPNLG